MANKVKKITCPECKGTKKCKACKGSGREIHWTLIGSQPCYHCGGGKKCPTCDGKGYHYSDRWAIFTAGK